MSPDLAFYQGRSSFVGMSSQKSFDMYKALCATPVIPYHCQQAFYLTHENWWRFRAFKLVLIQVLSLKPQLKEAIQAIQQEQQGQQETYKQASGLEVYSLRTRFLLPGN